MEINIELINYVATKKNKGRINKFVVLESVNVNIKNKITDINKKIKTKKKKIITAIITETRRRR